MPQVLTLRNKQFLKNHNFRQKFHILLILTGKNSSKLLEWHIFKVRGIPNPMALVACLYNNEFMKNHNFRRHIAEHGVQNHEHGMGHMQQSSLVLFYPYTMFQNPRSWPSHKKCRKTIITQKVIVTQSSNILHCNWHTQKPICADLQAFANTFPLCKLTFFHFLTGEFRKQPKFHILFILTAKNASKWLE